MSHATVMVIKRKGCRKSLAELMEPYDENLGIESEELDEEGNVISAGNPDAKWDWYSVGGRWSNMLILKGSGGKGSADVALAGEIDWDEMYKLPKDKIELHTQFWNCHVEGQPVPANASEALKEKLKWTYYKPKYYKDRYHNLANYLAEIAMFSTFAVLDSDKGWIESGELGWFGVDSGTDEDHEKWNKNFRSRFVDTLDPEDEIIIVDYHI